MLTYFLYSLRHVKRISRPAIMLLAAQAFLCPQAGQAAEILKLGFVTSLSGGTANRGQDFADGFKLGLKSLGGRLGGVETDLILIDDQGQPEAAVKAVGRMIEREHVHLISGPASPETVLAVAAAVKTDGGPLFVSPAFGPVSLAGADCRLGFFSLVPSDEVFAETLARALSSESPGGASAALIPANVLRAARQAETMRVLLPDLELFETTAGELVFDKSFQAIKASQPRSVAVLLGGGVGIGFLRQLHAKGLKGGKAVFVDWPLMEPAHLQALGESAIGLRAIAPWADDVENPVSHKFAADFEDEYRTPPSSFAALGFDLALILDQAVKNMGGRVADRSQFAKAFANSQAQGARGLIRFANNHFALTPLHLREGMRDAKGRLVAARKSTANVAADRHASACRLTAPEAPAPEESGNAKKPVKRP
ncbi:putative ABC transporter substrate binding protein [Rhodospirillaceae bacterium LM-1]|nr:putative ABC transporter substrate binding protein [Rhodospirillaceae bacterium LM-1]